MADRHSDRRDDDDHDDDGKEDMLLRSPLKSLAKGSTVALPAAPSMTGALTGSPRSASTSSASTRTTSKTAFFTSEICERHDVPGHPECAQRTRVIRERVLKEFPAIEVVRDIQRVAKDQLLRFHTVQHVESLARLFGNVASRSAMINIDEDTTVMEGTEDAAMIAAGAVCHAIDLVMSEASDCTNAFCGVRPPGHHAEPQRAMGFCFFNNVGVGACHLLEQYRDQIRRVLILDFDVHHGNGTQAKFYQDSEHVCFVSTHQGQFYPFTGKTSERGAHDNILNVPLQARTASQAYRVHFERQVLPKLHAFKPDFVLISAGFDAHRQDPLADIALENEDYYWITKHVTEIAWKYARGRIVSSLEGGYHLDALAESAAAHVRALIEGAVPPKPLDRNETATDASVDELTTAFVASTSLSPAETSRELRVTIHFDAKDKLVVLKERSTKALLQACKNKFPSLKKKAKSVSIQDAHGAVVTDAMLATLATDSHIYLR